MEDSGFEILKEKSGKIIKLIIKGRISATYADQFQKKLDEAIQEGPSTIILNMLQVIYLSSSGLKVILKGYKDAEKAGVPLGIEEPSENVLNILKMTALERLLMM